MDIIWRLLKKIWKEEEGIGTLEMILIIAVIVIIAIAFRKWIIQWVQKLLDTSNTEFQKTNSDTVTVPSLD
ncbi:MAG TPA: Flp1 family type IVb pilin [Bacilli bacterium]